MSKYTPRSWKMVKTLPDAPRCYHVEADDGTSITGWGSVRQYKEIARLIAAAPDLLGACKLALEHPLEDYVRDVIEIAIDKAEGRDD